MDSRNYGTEIGETAADLVRNENELKEQKKTCNKTKKSLEKLQADVESIANQISSIPAEIIDAEKTKKEIETLKKEVQEIDLSEESFKKKILSESTSVLENINKFLSTFSIEEYEKAKKDISLLEEEISELTGQHEDITRKVTTSKKKSSLDEVPWRQVS